MSSYALVLLVGLDHHCHRVPADEAPDAPFDFQIAGVGRFLGGRDGVDVGSIEWRRDLGAAGAESIAEALKEIGGAVGAPSLEHILERIQPLAGFFGIGIGLWSRSFVVAHTALGVRPILLSAEGERTRKSPEPNGSE